MLFACHNVQHNELEKQHAALNSTISFSYIPTASCGTHRKQNLAKRIKLSSFARTYNNILPECTSKIYHYN